jgi:hypothetical protein
MMCLCRSGRAASTVRTRLQAEQQRSPKERSGRQRKRPETFADQQSPPQYVGGRRRQKARAAVEEVVPLSSSPAELRTLATAIVNKLTSGCCKKGLTPLAPRRVQGDLALTLMFCCDGCLKPIDIPLGVKKKLNKMTEAEAKELVEQAERDGGKKPRTTTNARDEAQVRLVLGCLFSGNLYGQYERLCLAMQLEPMHHDTWAGYVAR